jgi:hypothetical protein
MKAQKTVKIAGLEAKSGVHSKRTHTLLQLTNSQQSVPLAGSGTQLANLAISCSLLSFVMVISAVNTAALTLLLMQC